MQGPRYPMTATMQPPRPSFHQSPPQPQQQPSQPPQPQPQQSPYPQQQQAPMYPPPHQSSQSFGQAQSPVTQHPYQRQQIQQQQPPPLPQQQPPPLPQQQQQQQQSLQARMANLSVSPPNPATNGIGQGPVPTPGSSALPTRPLPPSTVPRPNYPYPQQLPQQSSPPQQSPQLAPPPTYSSSAATSQRSLRPMNMRPAPGTIPTRPVPGVYPPSANGLASHQQHAPPSLPQQPQQPQPPPHAQQEPQQPPQMSPLIVPRPSHKVCGVPRSYYYRGMASLPDDRGMTIPYSNAEFISIDDGSARLRFARLTTNAVAAEPAMMTKSCVPFAVMLTPFANPSPGEAPVPVVDFSDKQVGGPLRCERCNGYANPGFKFLNGGQEFVCNLCGHICKTPPEHFSPISHTGQRMDIDSRPELRFGSVEYLVGSPDYWIRPPQPARYLFAFDVSAAAVASGLAAAAMLSAKSAIVAGLVPGLADGARVGIITFDKALHFFDGRGADDGKSVRMHYVPDVMEPFVPIGGNALFLTGTEAVAAIESAMEIHGLMNNNSNGPAANGGVANGVNPNNPPPAAECALGSALHAIKEAFVDCGGKAFVVAGSIPTAGVNRLERRGGGAAGSMAAKEDREMSLLKEANDGYDILGAEIAEMQGSVDLFLAPTSVYIDASTLSRVPHSCGGRMYLYTGFDAIRDGASLHRALCTAASEPRAFEALMRVRTSPGIEPRGEYIGHYGRPPRGDDVSGPVFDASSTLGLEMSVVSKLLSDTNSNGNGAGGRGGGGYYGNGNMSTSNGGSLHEDACVQCAVLFTDCAGRRRIRVHTVFARKSTVMADMFSSADVDATAAFLAKRVASAVLVRGTPFSKAWDGVMEKMAQMFYMYRKHCTSSSVSGQLILPESYKVLPLMMLGLVKSPALRKNAAGADAVTVDERAAALSFILSATISDVATFCYPRVWELQNLPDAAGVPLPPPQEPGVVSDANGKDASQQNGNAKAKSVEPISLPNTVAATAATLADNKILLIENGMQMIIWVGARVGEMEQLVNDLVTPPDMAGRVLIRGETANSVALLKDVGDVGKRVASIIQRVCSQRKSFSRPIVVERAKPGAGAEAKFVLPLLVEDRGAAGMYSYMEYLRVVHKEVMDRMADDSAQSDLATWEMLNHGY